MDLAIAFEPGHERAQRAQGAIGVGRRPRRRSGRARASIRLRVIAAGTSLPKDRDDMGGDQATITGGRSGPARQPDRFQPRLNQLGDLLAARGSNVLTAINPHPQLGCISSRLANRP